MELPLIDQALEPINIFLKPEKYRVDISVNKIVADDKVFRKGVDRYKELLKSGKDIGTLVVIKHPERDMYTVLDGHHRFFALKEMRFNEIKCAVIQDPFGLLFDLTKDGYLQPTVELTQHLVIPLKRFEEDLNNFFTSS